jgi:hypothetical protein
MLNRLWVAVVDTAPYVALFGLFLLLWQNTINPAVIGAISLRFRPAALLASLREGVWTSDFTAFYLRVVSSPDFIAFILAAAVCCLLIFIALLFRRRCAGTAGSVIAMLRLADVYVVLACIACPTVALESSSPVWTPERAGR